jgi:hypothetical protein
LSTNRAWILGELRRALIALSLPAREALATQPEGSVKADELALDYDNFLRAAVDNFAAEFTPAQREALQAVSRLLGEMSGPDQAGLWTDAAVVDHPKWLQVRERAHEARRMLGWDTADSAG